MKNLEKDNQRLKKIVADLELDKLILKELLESYKSKQNSSRDTSKDRSFEQNIPRSSMYDAYNSGTLDLTDELSHF